MSLVPSTDEDQPLLLKKIKHFSHDHPLILRKQQRNMVDGVESPITCYGCLQSISGLYYGCDRCMFFLDKSCAQLPREITHFSHPNHPLTLLPNPPIHYSRCVCDVCTEECNRFIYHCSECNFDVDAKCASVVHIIPQKIDHKSHNHQLIPLQKPAVFLCDACGTKHEGASYICTTCGFWINQICASSPLTVKLLIHHHPLTLTYSIERVSKSFLCAICDERLYRRNWIYRCSDCDYYVHINCAAIEIKNSRATEIETEQHDMQRNPIKIDSAVSGITTLNTQLSNLTVFPRMESSGGKCLNFFCYWGGERTVNANGTLLYNGGTCVALTLHGAILFDGLCAEVCAALEIDKDGKLFFYNTKREKSKYVSLNNQRGVDMLFRLNENDVDIFVEEVGRSMDHATQFISTR